MRFVGDLLGCDMEISTWTLGKSYQEKQYFQPRVNEEVAREAMRLASHKLPVKCKFVTRRDFEEMGGEE